VGGSGADQGRRGRRPRRRDGLDGDLDAIKLVWSYVDGKPTQGLDVSGEVEHTVSIVAIRRALGITS
jgi:hypothetical protein